MKVAFLNLLLVGLAACNPKIVDEEREKRALLTGGLLNGGLLNGGLLNGGLLGNNLGQGLFAPPLFPGLLSNLANPTKYNQVEFARCRQDFASLDLTRLRRLQNNQLYYFPTDQLTYANAKSYCDARGMQLVTFQSLAESVLVAEVVAKLYSTESGWSYAWIGLRDVPAGSGTYLWEYTNVAPATFNHWADSEPDVDVDQACVAFDGYETLTCVGWLTRDCTEDENFICEVPARCNPYLAGTVELFDNLE